MFERHPVPTPFPVEPVNVYLEGRTIVDPGPDTDAAWETVRTALAAHDLEPEDLERVLVTHPHPDHFGLAGRLRERGAAVLASEAAAEILPAYGDRLEYERTYFRTLFVRHGLAEQDARAIADITAGFTRYVADCTVDRVLETGDVVDLEAGTLSVSRLAGHAPGELCFAYEDEDEDDRCAIVGDHVLPEITPNPLLQPPDEPGGERPRVLPAFNDSLAALRDREFDRLLPGHGAVIERPTDRIDAILAAHERRTDAVRSLLDRETTAAAVMDGLFGELSPTEGFPGMSEAIGHLDVLEARGLARRREDNRNRNGNRITYEPAGESDAHV